MRDNSYIFITSDHGEMFERGELSHMTPLLNQPVVHIPLIVTGPGITSRKDIFATTSAIDLLPTITNLSGVSKPSWAEGEILPGLGGNIDQNRSIFSLEAKKNSAFTRLSNFSIALTKENKRLLFYQYGKTMQFELYDLDQDPEEMNNLHSKHPVFGKLMQEELITKVSEIAPPLVK